MVTQGEEFGFIKFGSRIDIYLPLGTKILVNLEDKPVGGETVIAELA
jgi:phosphatidylserine decarboxylase